MKNKLISGETSTHDYKQRRVFFICALMLAAACASIALSASRSTSTTFDEIIFIAGGARGFHRGSFDLTPEHPPMVQYLYGLPVWLAHPKYPLQEYVHSWRESISSTRLRYYYSQDFFWNSGNNPEYLALLGRSVAAVIAGLLVIVVFLWTRKLGDSYAGILAAGLVAFLPDVLAHGGIAYNDLPLALAFLLTVWAFDSTVRRPTPINGIIAGASFALALGIKFSTLSLVPIILLLYVFEWIRRQGDRVWRQSIMYSTLIILCTIYVCLVVIYRGDVMLTEMFAGILATAKHFSGGHVGYAYLLGRTSSTGWSYFFPVAFLLKTSFALHALLLLALLGFVRTTKNWSVRDFAESRMRAPIIAIVIFGFIVLTSKLAIGFRHAMPLLPLFCVLIGVGITRLWRSANRRLRVIIVLLFLWNTVSVMQYYPQFLTYTSEYASGPDRGHEVLLDSNLDWGQGLLELRKWMHAMNINNVYLSYFGSALPAKYGIHYIPLWSFFKLAPDDDPVTDTPLYAVISATNLHGLYFGHEDPFAPFRALRPVTILAHTLFVYRIDNQVNIQPFSAQ